MSQGWGGFFSKIVDASKSLATEYTKDLQEFVTVVAEDTSQQKKEIEKNLTTIKDKYGNNLVKNLSLGGSQEEEKVQESHNFYNRHLSDLEAIRKDPGTFCNEPIKSPEWENFRSNFSVSEKTEEIARLLSSHSELRALHNNLVPNAVPQDVFWERYFYRVWQIENEQSKRKQIIEATLQDDEEIKWDDEEEPSESKEEILEEKEEKNEEKKEEPNEEKREEKSEAKREEKGEEKREEKGEEKGEEKKKVEKLEKEEVRVEAKAEAKREHSKSGSDEYEIISQKESTETAEILDDENFEKALEGVQLDDVPIEEEGWGSDWE